MREDPFYWLRDDSRENPEIIAYLEAENAYTERMLSPLRELREALVSEMRARMQETDMHVPFLMGNYFYNHRYEEGHEYAIHVRRPAANDNVEHEEIVLDENERAEGQSYYALGGLRISPCETMAAVGEDTVSRRLYTIRVRDIKNKTWLPDTIEGTSGTCCWSADSRYLFYVRKDPNTLRAYQVCRHLLGTDCARDEVVFEEEDAEFYVQLDYGRTRKYLFIISQQTTCSEVRYIETTTPEAAPRLVLPRKRHHEYTVDHAAGLFYIRTNLNAPNFRLATATEQTLSDPEKWIDKVPHRDDVLLSSALLFREKLIVLERGDANTRLAVYPIADGPRMPIEFDEEVYVVSFGINRVWDSHTFRLNYQSPTTPPTIIDYDLRTGERVVRKQQVVLGGFDSHNYVAKRVHARARDGEEIPISLVYRKDLDRSQPNPLYLYAYGAYGSSSDAGFSQHRLSLLDRGVVFATAHVRGGQERTRRWYEEGKLLRKKNTFTDFIDCAEYLINEWWTEPGKLAAIGGSAGGLLVGAVANMRPDLFRAMVARVPFVDVVTTMLDETIPLTTFEYDEWGNPNDETYFRYMLEYSPYDNVKKQHYPDLFVTSGLHDSQVQFWEPTKWVAKLRQHVPATSQVLLKTNMEAGHGGVSGRFRALEILADEYAWILDRLGIAAQK